MTKNNPRRFTDKDSSSYGYPYGSQEWLDALDWPNEAERPMVSRNRAKALKLGMGKPDADQISESGSGMFNIGPRGGVKYGSRYLGHQSYEHQRQR